MLRKTIEGLDRVFRTEIEPPKVVLVSGPPGSMKTSFCYSVLAAHVKQGGDFGLYVTLEETVDSHIRNMKSLGVDLPLNMRIADFTDIREVDQIVEPEKPMDYVALVLEMVEHQKSVHGDRFTVFALDSLGALYSLMEDITNMRSKMFHFFKTLRDYGLVTFVVMERSLGGESQLLGNEGFLVDGIIVLGLDRTHGRMVRYIQVEKMRAVEHSMERHALEVRRGGLAVLGPLFEAKE